MRNNIRNHMLRAAVLAAAVIVLAAFTGCSAEYDDAEITAAAAELIEASYEINTVFFGEGLPTEEFDELDVMKYRKISEDSPYHTEDEIRAATLAVYTEDYSEFLFEKAFVGFSVEFAESSADEVSEPEIISARYVEYNGELVMLELEEDDILPLNRTYDTSAIKVEKKNGKRAVLSVPSFVDGESAGEVSLTVIMTDDGWRLDTPTY